MARFHVSTDRERKAAGRRHKHYRGQALLDNNDAYQKMLSFMAAAYRGAQLIIQNLQANLPLCDLGPYGPPDRDRFRGNC